MPTFESGGTVSVALPTAIRIQISNPMGTGRVAGMWTGTGPPPDEIPGAAVGDEYVDLDTGDIYELN